MRLCIFHIITNTEDQSADEFTELNKPMEIGAIQGMILDGAPHFHIVCSDPERTYVGHLEPGTEIQYLAEISLLEIADLELTRLADEFGIKKIVSK